MAPTSAVGLSSTRMTGAACDASEGSEGSESALLQPGGNSPCLRWRRMLAMLAVTVLVVSVLVPASIIAQGTSQSLHSFFVIQISDPQLGLQFQNQRWQQVFHGLPV